MANRAPDVPGRTKEKSAKLIKGVTIQIYPGAPHGLTATHQEQVNADLLAFIKG